MVGQGGSSASSYPTSPIPSHCASIVATSTLRVNMLFVLQVWLPNYCNVLIPGAFYSSGFLRSFLFVLQHMYLRSFSMEQQTHRLHDNDDAWWWHPVRSYLFHAVLIQ